MPSPIGHALGGLIAVLAVAPLPGPGDRGDAPRAPRTSRGVVGPILATLPKAWRPVLAWGAVAACLPDVDFAWGRHNMETHSVGFALILGAAAYARQRSPRVAVAVVLAVCTHAFFDWLGSDDMAPLGVMALWPFSTEFYYADAWLFVAISRRYWRDDFIAQNVTAVLREIVLLVPLVAALVWWRGRQSSRSIVGGTSTTERTAHH